MAAQDTCDTRKKRRLCLDGPARHCSLNEPAQLTPCEGFGLRPRNQGADAGSETDVREHVHRPDHYHRDQGAAARWPEGRAA
jgi:hypothetical protein